MKTLQLFKRVIRRYYSNFSFLSKTFCTFILRKHTKEKLVIGIKELWSLCRFTTWVKISIEISRDLTKPFSIFNIHAGKVFPQIDLWITYHKLINFFFSKWNKETLCIIQCRNFGTHSFSQKRSQSWKLRDNEDSFVADLTHFIIHLFHCTFLCFSLFPFAFQHCTMCIFSLCANF